MVFLKEDLLKYEKFIIYIYINVTLYNIIVQSIFFLSANNFSFLLLENIFKTSSTKTTGADTPIIKILYFY